ncbi:hypothetical protein D3C76_1419780 [compost metagenome]
MVGQGAAHSQVEGDIADHLAIVVAQACRAHHAGASTGNFTALVEQCVGGSQIQVCGATEQTVTVVQAGYLGSQAISGNLAADIEQRLLDTQIDGLIAEQVATAVVKALGGQAESLLAGDFAALVDHRGQVA